MMHTKAPLCRGCQAVLPDPFLDLGRTPLANALVKPEALHLTEAIFPLAVAYCETCHLVQLTSIVPPEQMFTDYLYFSSYSESFLAHAHEMANTLIARFKLTDQNRVLEIASNDGYLLQYFKQCGVPVLGIEPAKNIAAEAKKRGIPTLERFFGLESIQEIQDCFGQADIIIGNNVLAHVPMIHDFLKAVKICLKSTGSAVFEFPYLQALLDKTEFDTIYHEHVFYFSLSAIKNLAERAGLELFDVVPQTIHGGSLRVFLAHKGAYAVTSNVVTFLEKEKVTGLTSSERYTSFSQEVSFLKEKLLALLRGFKASGRKLAAYGAPAKGSTLLNFCGIGTDLLQFTVDRSPHKQGLWMPGSRLPIKPPDALLKEMPDYTLILPWNIAEEIIGQQKEYLERGGKFIIPVPTPKII